MIKIRFISTIVLLFTFGCTIPKKEQATLCNSNMWILYRAAEECAYVNKFNSGHKISNEKMSEFFYKGIEVIRCPSGGQYVFGIVGSVPQCSVHGVLTDALQEKMKKE